MATVIRIEDWKESSRKARNLEQTIEVMRAVCWVLPVPVDGVTHMKDRMKFKCMYDWSEGRGQKSCLRQNKSYPPNLVKNHNNKIYRQPEHI